MERCKINYYDCLALGINLPKWALELSNKGYECINALDFYNDIFGDDLEEERMPKDYVTGEYAAIALERVPAINNDGTPKKRKLKRTNTMVDSYNYMKRYYITKGNYKLFDLINNSDNFCLMSCISYAGSQRTIKNARYLYALIIEIDDINGASGLNELIYSWERTNLKMPTPTYMVCSGNGIHLYYVFERPIPLWKNIFENLSEAKKYFVDVMWNEYTSSNKNIQYEGINQPFRLVGSNTKDDNSIVLAFEVGKKVTIAYLNKFLPKDKKIDEIYKSNLSLNKAKEMYPEWYQRRIVDGKGKKHWDRYQPIYYNWINKIYDGAKVGKRYNCLENLCSLAVQCNIEPEQVQKDCFNLVKYLDSLTTDEDNHFTEYDMICALRTFDKPTDNAYYRKLDVISNKTGIVLIPNRRNGRKQEEHLKYMNFARDVLKYPNGDWREGNGRPKGSVKESTPKSEMIKQWRLKHPNGTKKQCKDETGLTYPTIRKWWDYD